MNFEPTSEQLEIRDMIRQFADEVIQPAARDIDREHRFPAEIIEQLSEMGLLGMYIPVEYSGSGLDHPSYIIAVEEIARRCASTAIILSAHLSLCTDPILKFGTAEQKQKWLPLLATGKKIGCFALSEPQSGSDAHNMLTRAELRGDRWIVNGNKNFITNGNEAGICLLICRGEKEGKSGHIALIVDREESPYTVGKPEEKLGIRGSSTTALSFEDCSVPAENILGGRVGAGFKIAMNTLDGGRIGVAAQALGIAQGALEMGVRYAKEREAFGQKVAEFQGIQWFIADMAVRIEAARLLTYRASTLKQEEQNYSTEAAMAKLYASETAAFAVSRGLQIHGGYGFIQDYEIERLFRDQKITEIYEGTSEIQRQLIAKNVLRRY